MNDAKQTQVEVVRCYTCKMEDNLRRGSRFRLIVDGHTKWLGDKEGHGCGTESEANAKAAELRSLAGEAAQPRFVDGKCRYCGEPEAQHLPDMCGYDKCKGQSCDKWIIRPQNPHQLCDECLLKYIVSLEERLAVSTPTVTSGDELKDFVEFWIKNPRLLIRDALGIFRDDRAALSPAQAAPQCHPIGQSDCFVCNGTGKAILYATDARPSAAQAVAGEPQSRDVIPPRVGTPVDTLSERIRNNQKGSEKITIGDLVTAIEQGDYMISVGDAAAPEPVAEPAREILKMFWLKEDSIPTHNWVEMDFQDKFRSRELRLVEFALEKGRVRE